MTGVQHNAIGTSAYNAMGASKPEQYQCRRKSDRAVPLFPTAQSFNLRCTAAQVRNFCKHCGVAMHAKCLLSLGRLLREHGVVI